MLYFHVSILFGILLSVRAWPSSDLLKQLLEQNRLEEALPVCRQYEVLPTRDDTVNFTCAWIYYRTFRPDAAETALQKSKGSSTAPEFQLLKIYGSVARELLPTDSIEKLGPEGKSQYELKLKARIIEAQKNLQDFIDRYKTHPIITKAKEVNGEFYEMKGQLEPAAFIYRGIISEQPKSARAHWGLGRYYLAQGDLRRAKVSLEETAILWPKHIGSRFNLALISISQSGAQKNDEAARRLTEAFKLDQSDPGILEQIGVLLEANGKALSALKYWKRALEINPKSQIASKKIQQNSALVVQDLISQEKWEESLTKIRSFSDPQGETPADLQLFEAIANRHLGRFQIAHKILKKVVEFDPNLPLATRELGICELNLNRADEAISLFERASKMEKQEGLNFAWLGFAFEAKKDYWKAAKSWNHASTLFKSPKEIKNAIEKVVRLEQKMGKRFIASDEDEFNDSKPEANQPEANQNEDW